MPGIVAPLTLVGGGGIVAPLTTTSPGGDTDPPVITLFGANPLQLVQGSAYVEPGFSAVDAVDGDLTDAVEVLGSINTNQIGQQSLTYRCTDITGNVATRVRVVNIVAPGATDTRVIFSANSLIR